MVPSPPSPACASPGSCSPYPRSRQARSFSAPSDRAPRRHLTSTDVLLHQDERDENWPRWSARGTSLVVALAADQSFGLAVGGTIAAEWVLRPIGVMKYRGQAEGYSPTRRRCGQGRPWIRRSIGFAAGHCSFA